MNSHDMNFFLFRHSAVQIEPKLYVAGKYLFYLDVGSYNNGHDWAFHSLLTIPTLGTQSNTMSTRGIFHMFQTDCLSLTAGTSD